LRICNLTLLKQRIRDKNKNKNFLLDFLDLPVLVI